MTLKEMRITKGLTQNECAKYLNVPPRTYWTYETDESKVGSIKYRYMLDKLEEYGRIDESHGILTVEQIKEICGKIFADYNIEYAYLFGSYAKGKATETSDVDLLVAMPIDGILFYELVERLREELKKKVDLLDEGQLDNNKTLIQEILKDGIKIYG